MLSGNDTDPSFDQICPDSRMRPDDTCAVRCLVAVLAAWTGLTVLAAGGGCFEAPTGAGGDGKGTGQLVGWGELPGQEMATFGKGCP